MAKQCNYLRQEVLQSVVFVCWFVCSRPATGCNGRRAASESAVGGRLCGWAALRAPGWGGARPTSSFSSYYLYKYWDGNGSLWKRYSSPSIHSLLWLKTMKRRLAVYQYVAELYRSHLTRPNFVEGFSTPGILCLSSCFFVKINVSKSAHTFKWKVAR